MFSTTSKVKCGLKVLEEAVSIPIGDVDFRQHLNSSFMNTLAIIAGIPVLVSVYGVIRRQRFFFLLGYLLYALIVVPNELGEYMATGSMERLAVAMIWTLQGVLAFPNKLNYDGSKVFKSFGIKTFLFSAAIEHLWCGSHQSHADASRIHRRPAHHDRTFFTPSSRCCHSSAST